jgi:hypothetical protein
VLRQDDPEHLMQAYEGAIRIAVELNGVGKGTRAEAEGGCGGGYEGGYTAKHLLRTWLLMYNISHPFKKFLVMGRGADDHKYNSLRAMGLVSVAVINQLLVSGRAVDAGEVAYILCLGEECNGVLALV